MRRLEQFEEDTEVTVLHWLDEYGNVTTDEDDVEDIVVKLNTGEECVVSNALFCEMHEAGAVDQVQVN